MADERSGERERLTADERLDRIKEAMVWFNRRQDEDLALSRIMKLDFLQEFRSTREAVYVMAAVLFTAIVTMSIG